MSILSVKNLSKSFGKLEVLNDISFNVEKGEVISISGPVGRSGTLIISIPKYSVIAKCLSYPGTGHKNFTLSNLHHGVLPMIP